MYRYLCSAMVAVEAEAAPVASPLESAPLESAPLEATPLESTPLESTPLESAPVEGKVSVIPGNVKVDELTTKEISALFAQYPNLGEDLQYQSDDDMYNNCAADSPLETLQIVRDLENTIATIDDTTIDTRDRVSDLSKMVSGLTKVVKSLQAQVTSIDGNLLEVKSQNAALTKEVHEFNLMVVTMREQLTTLIKLLAAPASDSVTIPVVVDTTH